MPQLDYDYDEAYEYQSSGRRKKYSDLYDGNAVRKTSDKTKSQVFMLMNDTAIQKPRYKSISEYDVPQEIRTRGSREKKRQVDNSNDIDLIVKHKTYFDYDTMPTRSYLASVKSKPEQVELDEVESDEEDKKAIRREERKKVFRTIRNTFMCMIGFAVAILILYRYSLINEKFNQVEKAKKELASIESVNEQIQAYIDSETDLSYIENYAKYQLGMQKPQDSQTIYINAQKQDRIFTPARTYEEVEEENALDKLLQKISDIF